MKFFMTVLILILVAVGAIFAIKGSDLLLLGAFMAIISGFFFAVSTIAKEETS